MKLGLMKRVLATGLCVAMFMGDVLPAIAIESVSGGDAVDFVQEENIEVDQEAEISAEETTVEEAVVEEENTVSGNGLVEIGEELLPLVDGLEDIVLETEVSGVTITLTAPAGTVPAGAELWAEEIDQTADLAIIDEALEAEAEKEEITVQQYKAFDIKILVDGEEVQPEGEVKVSFAGDILLPQNENEVVNVYHVSEDAVANDMAAIVTEDAAVEMETEHFSVYVIAVAEDAALSEYQLTVDHNLADGSDFYKAHTYTVNRKQEIQIGVVGGDDYDVERVVVTGTVKKADGTTVETIELTKASGDFTVDTVAGGKYLNITNNNEEAYKIYSDVNVTLYYVAGESKTIKGDVTYFDYSVLTEAVTEEVVLIDEKYEDGFHYGPKGTNHDEQIIFTYNGNKVWNYDILDSYKKDGRTYYNVLHNKDDDSVILFGKGESIVLTDVEMICWDNWNKLPKREYSQVVVSRDDNTYKYVATIVHQEASYYDSGINANAFNADGTRKNNYLAMGILGFHGNVLNVVNQYNNNNLMDANANNTNRDIGNGDWQAIAGNEAIAEGLIVGLEDLNPNDNKNDYKKVVWGNGADGNTITEPGYFSVDAVEGKTIYAERFELQFTQTGHKYVLDGSIDNGENDNSTPVFTAAGKGNAGFFPLNTVDREDTVEALLEAGLSGEAYNAQVREHEGITIDENIGNNCYFGMRYDFQFTLGDYEGKLEYIFEGDDDLWVFLDGKPVLDLGGIHSAYPSKYKENADKYNGVTLGPDNTVDLWQYIKAADGSYDADAEHQITVLYMERGGYDSNCYMEFTLPNAKAMKSVISTKEYAELSLNKLGVEKNIETGAVEETEALAGVTFTLTDSNNNVVETAVTNAQGNVVFAGLSKGTYVLTETAPEGYYGAGPWTVEVTETKDGDNIVYSIASVKEDGNVLTANNGIYTIENVKIPPAISQEKTVEVVNWDERTYKITLNASSLMQKVEEVEGSVDIVLTLDISGSMDENTNVYEYVGTWPFGYYRQKTRLQILKESVNSFIDKVAEISPDSKIAIVTYGNVSATVVKDLTTLDANGVNSLETAVNGLSTNGGTPQHLGFKKANEVISKSTNDNKYVIFVGDGRPEFFTSYDNDYKNILSAADDLNLLTSAEQEEFKKYCNNNRNGYWNEKQPYLRKMVKHFADLTKQNATVMTLGIALDNDTKALMKEYASSDSYAYTTDTLDDMTAILDEMGDTIMSNMPVTGASIVDYIDNRFELISADGTKLAVGATVTDANGNTGTVCEDSKGVYVKWDDTTIQAADQNGAGWTAEIYVKAKDEFIGGNFIPTNGDNSGITVDDEFFPFDKPTTNVKLLAIDIENKEIDLFKGDDIVPADYVAELNDSLSVISIEDEKVALAGAPQLTDDQVATLIAGKTLTVPYSYAGDEIGSFVYAVETEYTWETHVAEQVGENVENYKLKVYFDATSVADRADEMEEAGFEAPVAGTPEVDVTTPTQIGTYVVNVVAGSLEIKKTIDLSKVNFAQGDPIFTFKVMKDGEFYSYHTVRYTEASQNGTVVAATLTDLAKGVYTVEELDTLRYDLASVNAEGSADKKVNATTATFGIGRDIETADTQMENLAGIASFENTRTNSKNYSHTDVAVNTFVIDENGNISWTADTLAQ